MSSPLYSLLKNARSLTDDEREEAMRLLNAGDYDPNESHQAAPDTPYDQQSLLELLARNSARSSSMGLEQLVFFSQATQALLDNGADPSLTNGVGQTPDRLASDRLKRLLMAARGVSYEQEQARTMLNNFCHTYLANEKSVLKMRKADAGIGRVAEQLKCPAMVSFGALAFTGAGWAKNSPGDPKKMLVSTTSTIRIRQLERLLKLIPSTVAAPDQAAAKAVFLAAFKAAQSRKAYGWEDDAQALWKEAEKRLEGAIDWNEAARQAIDGRFGAMTPQICQAVLLANGPCTTPERTALWLDAMSALSRCPIDDRGWLEADHYRHFLGDTRDSLTEAWQPDSILGPAPKWDAQTKAAWTTAFSPSRGTEVLVQIMCSNLDGTAAGNFDRWKELLQHWVALYPEQATRVPTLAYHAVSNTAEAEGMRQSMRSVALESALPAPAEKPKPRMRF